MFISCMGTKWLAAVFAPHDNDGFPSLKHFLMYSLNLVQWSQRKSLGFSINPTSAAAESFNQVICAHDWIGRSRGIMNGVKVKNKYYLLETAPCHSQLLNAHQCHHLHNLRSISWDRYDRYDRYDMWSKHSYHHLFLLVDWPHHDRVPL